MAATQNTVLWFCVDGQSIIYFFFFFPLSGIKYYFCEDYIPVVSSNGTNTTKFEYQAYFQIQLLYNGRVDLEIEIPVM